MRPCYRWGRQFQVDQLRPTTLPPGVVMSPVLNPRSARATVGLSWSCLTCPLDITWLMWLLPTTPSRNPRVGLKRAFRITVLNRVVFHRMVFRISLF